MLDTTISILSSVAIPVLIVIIGGISEALVNYERLRCHHFLMGKELALTSLSVAAAMLLDGARVAIGLATNPTLPAERYPLFGVVIVVALLCFVVLLAQGQSYRREQRGEASIEEPALSFSGMVKLNSLGALPLAVVFLIIVY